MARTTRLWHRHAGTAQARSTVPPESERLANKLVDARARYYTPTASGLRRYHCDVTAGWAGSFHDSAAELPTQATCS